MEEEKDEEKEMGDGDGDGDGVHAISRFCINWLPRHQSGYIKLN